MTETGKPTDSRQRHLTEGGLALTATPGQNGWTPCDRTTIGSRTTCPHLYPHQCSHNDWLRTYASVTATISRLHHDRDTGNKWDGWWDALQHAIDRQMTLNSQLTRSQIEHDALRATAERELLHKQNADNARAKLGPWEFTLTYSPAKHGWSADEAKDAMRTAIERLTRYYREELEEFHAVGEYTQAGAPHVHAWYKLGGGRRMTTKSFRRAYPIWNERAKLGRGHEGGHHEPVKRTSDFAGYVEKHLETAWLQIDITNADQEARVSEEEDGEEDGTSVPSAASRSTEPHDG